MSKSRSQQRREAVQRGDTALAKALAETSQAPSTVKLKLKQREFVRGKLCEGGTVHEFSPDEAKKRLQKTDKWIQA